MFEYRRCGGCRCSQTEKSNFYKGHGYCRTCIALHNSLLIKDSSERYLDRRDVWGFVKKLLDKKTELGHTLESFEKHIGVSKGSMSKWRHSKQVMLQATQHRIAQQLGIPFDEYLYVKSEKGEYASGLRVCKTCESEFLVYKNSNYLVSNCQVCIEQGIEYGKRK